jgi:hypothetical protein
VDWTQEVLPNLAVERQHSCFVFQWLTEGVKLPLEQAVEPIGTRDVGRRGCHIVQTTSATLVLAA